MSSPGTWVNVYTGDPSPLAPRKDKTEADIFHYYCAYTVGQGLALTLCSVEFACGVCLLENQGSVTWFQMKGICQDNVDQVKWYDVYYYMHGLHNGRPHLL